ncbi:MAG: O-methyltransferase [Candidatus Kapaibacterium sp.]|nr:O-methyltransferase [Ignavibacteria bacterium]
MKGTPLNDRLVDYMVDLFPSEDDLLRDLNAEAEGAGIPPIQISPEQATFLGVFLQGIGARRVIEIGTLAGYSAIVMARALPDGGHIDTIEIDPLHAEFAREQFRKAGLEEKITLHVGAAVDVLERKLKSEPSYDFAFIDADKPSYTKYVDILLPMIRPGGIIAGDNALAWGEVADSTTDREDVQGIQVFNKYMAEHPDINGTIVPVGDGMCIGVVRKTN